MLLYYKYSKTNQHASKVSWIPIQCVKDERFNLKKYLSLVLGNVKMSKSSPLFSFNNRDFHTRNSLVRLLDNCIFEAGLSFRDFSWHSFRRGAASFAFELGLPDSSVQLLGDWSSSAFQNYLEFSVSRKLSLSKRISNNFDMYIKDC